jgi:hypothetical protein
VMVVSTRSGMTTTTTARGTTSRPAATRGSLSTDPFSGSGSGTTAASGGARSSGGAGRFASRL